MRHHAMLGAVLLAVAAAAYAGSATETNPGVPWPATDALGRTLPVAGEVGPVRPDRFVGIFYFIDHEEQPAMPGGGPPDISKIFARDPDALRHPDSPLWGPAGASHYWGEPLFGYYQSTDRWVLRRHARLLADAGIDTLIFDTTNAQTYPKAYHALCEVFTAIRREGGRTPQIAFMVNTDAGATADKLFHDLYEPGKFRDLWFVWQGKPLLICDPAAASPRVKQFFTLRAAHWPFTLVNTPYAWHWETTYPQVYGYTDDPKKPEQVNVAVAQNLRASDGGVTNMSEGNARGRSFHDGREDSSPGAVDRGLNFAEQWKRALQLDPPFVMVTGWNEWIASRFGKPHERPVFVDQFDEEFSRDIEPMKGGHGDNYYYQLVENVRRYKGVPPIPAASSEKTIRIDGPFDQWHGVAPEYTDSVGDTAPRDAVGVTGAHYTDHSGRNDLEAFKVARDAENVYFYARTHGPLTSPHDPHWMWLLISTGRPATPNWEGYDFIVNRTIDPDGSTWLERSTGGWKWEKVAKLSMRAAGNELQLAVPRKFLGLTEPKLRLDFKWADNLQHPGEVSDFYLSGDVAPEGRFRFRYSARE